MRVFLPELDDKSNPLKSKGIGELGICGAGAAVANAVYNADRHPHPRLSADARQDFEPGVTAHRHNGAPRRPSGRPASARCPLSWRRLGVGLKQGESRPPPP